MGEAAPPSLAAEALRALHRFDNEDANRASRWECIHAAATANVCSFSPHGLALAVATTKGEVHLWDMYSPSRTKVGVLRLPDEPLAAAVRAMEADAEAAATTPAVAAAAAAGGADGQPPLPASILAPMRGTGVRPFQSITCLGWSSSGRLLFAGTAGGLVAVWDLCSPDPGAAHAPLAVFKLPQPARAIRPHPSDPSLLLVVTWVGMPFIVQWIDVAALGDAAGAPGGGAAAATLPRTRHASDCGGVPEASLDSEPTPLACLYRLNHGSSGAAFIKGGRAWRLPEVALPPPRAKKAKQSALKGQPLLRVDACFRPTDGRQVFLATSRGDVVQAGLLLDAAGADRSSGPRLVRLAHTSAATIGAPIGVAFPEIHHSRHSAQVAVTTRSGIVCLSTEGGLTLVDKGYSEPVDNTPLVSCRFSAKDRFIVALPHERSGHMAGGVYFFRRGVLGSFKLRLGPASGIASIDSHPRLGILVGVTQRSQVFLLAPPLHAVFPGPMFPPFFVMTLANKDYPEPEDEFDLVDVNGRFRYHAAGSVMEGRGEPLVLGGEGTALQHPSSSSSSSSGKPYVAQAPPEVVAGLLPVNISSDAGTLGRLVKQAQARLLSGGAVAPSASAPAPSSSPVVSLGGSDIDLSAAPEASTICPHIYSWWAAKEEVLATYSGSSSGEAAGAGAGGSSGGGSGAARAPRGASGKKKAAGKAADVPEEAAAEGGKDAEAEPATPVAAAGEEEASVAAPAASPSAPASLEEVILAKISPLPEGTNLDADTGLPEELLGLDSAAPIAFALVPVTGAPPLTYLLPPTSSNDAAPLVVAAPSLLQRLHALLHLQPIPAGGSNCAWPGLHALPWADLPSLAAALVAGPAATGAFAAVVAAASAAVISSAGGAAGTTGSAASSAYLASQALCQQPCLTLFPGWRSGEMEGGDAGNAHPEAVSHVLAVLQGEWQAARARGAVGSGAPMLDDGQQALLPAPARTAAGGTSALITAQIDSVDAAAKDFLKLVAGAHAASGPSAAAVAAAVDGDAAPPSAKRARLA